MADVLGPIYTKGKSYRARAEARQREYRASIGVPHGSYGHFLAQEAADAGRNFVLPESFQAARVRQSAGKGESHDCYQGQGQELFHCHCVSPFLFLILNGLCAHLDTFGFLRVPAGDFMSGAEFTQLRRLYGALLSGIAAAGTEGAAGGYIEGTWDLTFQYDTVSIARSDRVSHRYG